MQIRRFRFAISRYGGLWLKDMWRHHAAVFFYNVELPHLLAKFLQLNNRTELPEQEI
jgi:hypothetical protein